jgi:hypothetical protein
MITNEGTVAHYIESLVASRGEEIVVASVVGISPRAKRRCNREGGWSVVRYHLNRPMAQCPFFFVSTNTITIAMNHDKTDYTIADVVQDDASF